MALAPREAGFGYRAFLIDIDGTLLDGHDQITDRTRAAIDRARAKGIRVFLATGRSIHGARKVHEDLGLDTPLVCYNGLVIFEPSTEDWLYHRKVPDELVPELLQVADQRAAFYFLFHNDRKYTLHFTSKVHEKMAKTLKNVEQVKRARMPTRDVTKINFYADPAGADEVRAVLKKAAAHLQVDVFPLSAIPAFRKLDLMYLDVQPVHDGKAQALDYLQAEYGIPPAAVVAFGDQVNDRPMLRKAGLGVAMGNAPDTLKRDAVMVTGKNTQDGLAVFIETMF